MDIEYTPTRVQEREGREGEFDVPITKAQADAGCPPRPFLSIELFSIGFDLNYVCSPPSSGE
jgi:hypothetical protein